MGVTTKADRLLCQLKSKIKSTESLSDVAMEILNVGLPLTTKPWDSKKIQKKFLRNVKIIESPRRSGRPCTWSFFDRQSIFKIVTWPLFWPWISGLYHEGSIFSLERGSWRRAFWLDWAYKIPEKTQDKI